MLRRSGVSLFGRGSAAFGSTPVVLAGHGPTDTRKSHSWHTNYPTSIQESDRDMYHSYYPYLFDHGDKMSLYPKIPSNPREWQPEQLQTFYDAIREDKYDAFLRLREKFPELYEDTRRWDNPPSFGEFNQFYSVRHGLIGVKAFTTTDFDEFGNEMNLTALWVPDNQVIGHRTKGVPGSDSVVIGAMNVPPELHPPHISAMYKARQVPVKHVCCEFKITPDAYVPVGTKLDVRHLRAGQEVDIQFQSTDYGFQGVMFRYGFDGGWVWLGDSRSQRRPGSIGTEGSGRVFPGSRSTGQTGAKHETKNGMPIWRIDYKNSLVYINGLMDADIGCYVKIDDTLHTKGKTTWSDHRGLPPFPTFVADPNEDLSSVPTEDCQLLSTSFFHTFRDEHSKSSQITQGDIDDSQSAKQSKVEEKREVYDLKKYVEARKKVRQGSRKSRKWRLAGLRARATEKADETRARKLARFKRVK